MVSRTKWIYCGVELYLIVIIFNLDRKNNRHHYHTPSQQRTSVRDERIVTYVNVLILHIHKRPLSDTRYVMFGTDQDHIVNSL